MNLNKLKYLTFGQYQDVILLLARLAIVALFIIFGIPKLMGFDGTVQYMASLSVPFPTIAAIGVVIFEVFLSLLIVLGYFTRPISFIFVFYVIATGFIGHPYWTMTGDAVEPNMINFYKNISIAGAFLLLSVAGAGRFSLDRK